MIDVLAASSLCLFLLFCTAPWNHRAKNDKDAVSFKFDSDNEGKEWDVVR